MSTMDPVLLQFKMQVGMMLAKMHSGSDEEQARACNGLLQLAHDPKLRAPLVEIGAMGALAGLLVLEGGAELVKVFVTMIIAGE
jgi:hypothetical protein